jgi:hypothetical protein
MGLVPVGTPRSDALWFGTGVHIALAEWYKHNGKRRGPYPSETFEAWAEGEIRWIKTAQKSAAGNGLDSIIEEKLVPAKQLGIAMLEGYVKEWGKDPHWSIIAREHSGQIDITDPNEVDKLLVIYAFTYDGVTRDLNTGNIELIEHKTAQAISTDHLPLDDQAGSYWAIASQELAASGLIKPTERISGIRYNFLRKALPDDRPKTTDGHATNKPVKDHFIAALKADGAPEPTGKAWEKLTLVTLQEMASYRKLTVLGEISKIQPKPLFERELVRRTAKERATQIRRIQDEALWMREVREGRLPLIKNPTNNCQWDCDFYAMCQLDEAGDPQGVREYRAEVYARQDPYADHRKSTEE